MPNEFYMNSGTIEEDDYDFDEFIKPLGKIAVKWTGSDALIEASGWDTQEDYWPLFVNGKYIDDVYFDNLPSEGTIIDEDTIVQMFIERNYNV